MRLRTLICSALMCSLVLVAEQVKSTPVSPAPASEIPRLRKQGTATQLIVDGKPFLALAGELLNNSATDLDYMQPLWPKLVEANLNSVLAGVSWAQIEPQEGKFDFSALDGLIRDARSHNLRLVLLWFGSWVRGYSIYAPVWLKKDFERFPRARISGGKSIELISPFSDANRDADARALAALMRRLKAVDGQQHTVIMLQLENEVGVLGDSRDRSPLANKAFEGPVPKELMDYLQKNKETLVPEFRKLWEAAGFKTSGTWEEVFGQGVMTDEIFMAWNYARYIGRVAGAGKAEYALPMFVNAWLYGFGRPNQPGRTPSGGPLPHVMDLWKAGGRQIDMLSPDLYNDFAPFCALYTRSGNPLFIPEANGGRGGAARALYAFGRHNAIGFSPFGIERTMANDPDLAGIYDLLSQLAPLILEHQGKGSISAVLMNPKDPPQKIQLGNYTFEAALTRPRAIPGAPPPPQNQPSGAIFIATGPDEFFAIGIGLTVTFSPNTPGPEYAGLGTVEEGKFVNGRWVPRLKPGGDDIGPLEYLEFQNMSLQRFTLYRYR